MNYTLVEYPRITEPRHTILQTDKGDLIGPSMGEVYTFQESCKLKAVIYLNEHSTEVGIKSFGLTFNAGEKLKYPTPGPLPQIAQSRQYGARN